MNIRLLAIAGLLSAACFSSCKKDDNPPVATQGKVTVSVANEVDGVPVVFGPMNYTNASGNKYGVDVLKYYISHFTLVKADGSERVYKNHELIDASLPETPSFTLDSVQNGDYTAVKFYLGVDFEHNHTGAQEGDLDPMNGMIWTWSTGYMFFKHEGNFKDSAGGSRTLVFHFGADDYLPTITVPISKLTVAGNARKLFLKFNLNSVYTSPHTINFNDDNSRMSGIGDEMWMYMMQKNLADAFQFDKAE
jgi:hypothetical protein